jgi:hypothetical protein
MKTILQNSEPKHKKSYGLHKVQEFHQTNFSAPDGDRVGRNILCETEQI